MGSDPCVFRRKVGFWVRGPASVCWCTVLGEGLQTQTVPAPLGSSEHLLALAPHFLALGCLFPAPQLGPCTSLLGPGQQQPWFAGLPFGVKIRNPGGACGLFQLHYVGQGVSLFWT